MTARSLIRLDTTSPLVKHAVHDQSDHGNWARGKTLPEPWRDSYMAQFTELVKVSDLQQWIQTDRMKSDRRGTLELAEQIKINGFYGPVFLEVRQTPEGGMDSKEADVLLVEGNHRVAVAEHLGITHVPVTVLATDYQPWRDMGDVPRDQLEGLTFPESRSLAPVRVKLKVTMREAWEGEGYKKPSQVLDLADIRKHWGPGPHPGTGTPQTIHAPGGGLNPEAADKVFETALAPLIAKFGAPKGGFTYAAGVSPVAFKWFNEIYAQLNEDDALFAEYGSQLDTWWDTRRAVEGENERDLYMRLALGEISVEEATNLGLSEYNSEIRDLGDLPRTVYHVTTDTKAVLANGLKSRDEIGQEKGLGLGGGTANTISFTDDEETARGILRGMQERHAVLNDPATHIPRLIEEAKSGEGTKRPWWHSSMDTKWTSAAADKLSDGGVDALLKGEAVYVASLGQKTTDELRTYWATSDHYNDKYDLDSIELIKPATQLGERAVFRAKYTPKGYAEAVGDFMDEYAAHRQGAGGHLDPLFIFNDDYSFAQKDISDFSVIKGKTKPGTRGYNLGSLSEWRTWTGEVLESMEVLS